MSPPLLPISAPALSPDDRRQLIEAAETLLDARTLTMRIADGLGHAMAETGGIAARFLRRAFDIDLRADTTGIVERLLWTAQTGALFGLDAHPAAPSAGRLHRAIAVASGAASGFVGTPGLLWDLPITTTMIMRSVAEIARAYPGESLHSAQTRRACIEVFSLGAASFATPETAGEEDADAGYWAARVAIDHTAIGIVIRQAAARFGVVLTEKSLATLVPVIGAVAGAGLNNAYVTYYQSMARVHFALRDLERRAEDPRAIRAAFTQTLRQIGEHRRPHRRHREPVAM